MRHARRWALAAVVAVAGACGDDEASVRPDAAGPGLQGYATACTLAADCMLVDLTTEPCCGGCPEAAISRADEARYRDDRARLRATCASTAPCPPTSCPRTVAVCEASACRAETCSPECPTDDAGP